MNPPERHEPAGPIEREMARGDTVNNAYVALGSNVGARLANLLTAVNLLIDRGDVERRAASSVYETSPVGGPPGQNDYLNAVVHLHTRLDAPGLLVRCHDVERRLGRTRSVPDGPRVIDLDILLFNDAVIVTDDLQVPHPRMHRRRFVLEPLVEIAPHVRHPVLGLSAARLLRELPSDDRACRRIDAVQWSAQ